MKTIVCFGDSNTWGFNPEFAATYQTEKNLRFPRDVRWPGVLRNTLGGDYSIIEEGLGGRTTVWEDPLEGGFRNGKDYLLPCLWSHQPIDLITIMLGTNDLKRRFSVSAADIAAGAGVLIDIARGSGAGIDLRPPEILLICPPPTGAMAGTPFAAMFSGAEETSRQLAPNYERVAKLKGVHFFNAGSVIESSPLDAIHFSADAHAKLGKAVAEKIKAILG